MVLVGVYLLCLMESIGIVWSIGGVNREYSIYNIYIIYIGGVDEKKFGSIECSIRIFL